MSRNLRSWSSFVLPLCLVQVVPWFWVAVSSFTQDELARLVQFTTGTSQLPPDGFSELKPQFQISPAPVHGSLPTSHTWWVGSSMFVKMEKGIFAGLHFKLTIWPCRLHTNTTWVRETHLIFVHKVTILRPTSPCNAVPHIYFFFYSGTRSAWSSKSICVLVIWLQLFTGFKSKYMCEWRLGGTPSAGDMKKKVPALMSVGQRDH